MNKFAPVILLCIVFTVLGLVGGWTGARQTSSGGGGHGGDAHGHAHGEKEKEDEHGHDHAAHAKPKISPETAKNLGITVADAESKTFYKYQAVPAVITEGPANVLPIVAPIGGTVSEIAVQPGMLVEAGSTLAQMLREALPRPTLTLTEEIIKPVSEQAHAAVADLRKSLKGVEILRTELDRIKKFTETGTTDGLAILPKKNEIDLKYDLVRAEQELENAREKLRLHGFSSEEISDLEGNKAVTAFNQQIWRRALQRNGLWPNAAEKIYNALPEQSKSVAWNIGAIGELAGAGLLSDELAGWIESDKGASEHFLEIAGLLQQGNTLKQVQTLRRLNVLGPVLTVQAPSDQGQKDSPIKDWDIREVSVRPLQRIEVGAQVLSIANPSQMILKSEPIGTEATWILKALSAGTEIEAVPLVTGSGPHLKALKIAYVTSDHDARGTVAFVYAKNELLHTVSQDGHRFRSWQLRAGQRYMLRIPTDKLDDVYVLPSDAVTEDGPDKVVFIQDGESYKSVKAVIAYQDHEVAVIDAKNSEIFPGDQVVQHGAFALGLALKAGSGAADPHAGHNH